MVLCVGVICLGFGGYLVARVLCRCGCRWVWFLWFCLCWLRCLLGVCVLRVWVVLEWYWMLVCSPGVRDLFAFLLADVSVNCWWWVSCCLVGVRLLCLALFGSCLFGG